MVNLMKPESVKVPLPKIDAGLTARIRAEFGQQVRLSEKNLPSIGTIALNFAYR